MKIHNRKIIIILCILGLIILSGISWFIFAHKNNDDSKVIVKDNVFVISEDTEEILDEVTENSLFFTRDAGYSEGDVIVAGIIEKAPNGFLRKVVSVTEVNGVFEYKTEYAVLTDVFEEAHIVKTFVVTDEEVRDVDAIDNNVMQVSSKGNAVVQTLAQTKLSAINIQQTSTTSIEPSENGLGIVVALEDNLGESLKLTGELEVATYFELKIDIENEEIDFGIVLHTDTNGELFVGYKEQLFDKDDDKFNGEYEKEIIEKTLPNIQFAIGPVPVVITNDFNLSAEISAQLEGQIGTSVGVDAERVSGFEYSSKTGKIKEINEKKYLSDGMEWKTEAKASGELEAGIYAHLITKLYGSTGTDLSVGVAGKLAGELAVGIDENFESEFYGNLELSIAPKIRGQIVVTVPIVDYDLVEAEILKASMPAFWEKKWEIPDPMLVAMKKGDFSCFAGRYIATPEDNDAYGGGQKLNPIELRKDGTLKGFYDSTRPISVEKSDDGAYRCTFNKDIYYVIYPVGVIENIEYMMENMSYLYDVVYIRCFAIDGGVYNPIFYSDSIEKIVTDYDGDDWVSQEAYTEEIGARFISGTGIEYKVIATENNFDVGGSRTRTVLETKDGKRWMIPNLPAFQYDVRTEIVYFNIYPYRSNPDYVQDI